LTVGWSKRFFVLGLVLTVVGVLPVLIGITLLPGLNPLVPTMLALSLMPLGLICLGLALILFLAGLVRR